MIAAVLLAAAAVASAHPHGGGGGMFGGPEPSQRQVDFWKTQDACKRSVQNYCFDEYIAKDAAAMLVCAKAHVGSGTEPFCPNMFKRNFPAMWACAAEIKQFCPSLLGDPLPPPSSGGPPFGPDRRLLQDASVVAFNAELMHSKPRNNRDGAFDVDPRQSCVENNYPKFSSECTTAIKSEWSARSGSQSPQWSDVTDMLAAPQQADSYGWADRGDMMGRHHRGVGVMMGMFAMACCALMILFACVRHRRKRQLARQMEALRAQGMVVGEQGPVTHGVVQVPMAHNVAMAQPYLGPAPPGGVPQAHAVPNHTGASVAVAIQQPGGQRQLNYPLLHPVQSHA